MAAPFESRADYAFPFATRAEWLAFIHKGPGGVAAASSYDGLFPEADYVRDGVATRASRITYRSDGLLIRGLIVEPRTPGPHPVIIFNHGGVMQWGRIILPEVLEFHRLAERGYLVVVSTYRGKGAARAGPAWAAATWTTCSPCSSLLIGCRTPIGPGWACGGSAAAARSPTTR